MKRVIAVFMALGIVLCVGGAALAQDEMVPVKSGKAFEMLDANADGKVTKEEFMASAQKRAEARFAKLDQSGKGYLTKEDYAAARKKIGEKAKARKAKAPADQ